MKRLLVTAFAVAQLFFILWSCCRDLISIVAEGHTSLPDYVRERAKDIESTTVLNFRKDGVLSLLEEIVVVYKSAAGIDSGYGYFAPAVPSSSKVVFELFYDDGHAEYELPTVSGQAAGLRFSSFLYQLTNLQYDPLRELIIRMLAYDVWEQHPAARKIRAVVGFIRVPLPGEKTIDYQFQYAYEFVFGLDQ